MFSNLKDIFSKNDNATPLGASDAMPIDAPPAEHPITAYCSIRNLPNPDFPHTLNTRRDRSDPELQPHLTGLVGTLLGLGNGAMTRTRYHVMRHIQKVQNQVGLSLQAENLERFGAWAVESNALLFLPDGSIRDPYGRILLQADGAEPDPEARIPYPEDAVLRKSRSDQLLRARGIPMLDGLPPVPANSEAEFRSAPEVASRVLALFAVALRAESLAQKKPIPTEELRARLPLAFAALSPREQEFFDKPHPTSHDIAQFGWRYECVNTLAWSLGALDQLPFPAAICDVGLLAHALLNIDTQRFVADARLRPDAELLDALDLHTRLHWATMQAQLARKKIPDGLEAGVILERHYALNWLSCFENAEWDEVDTPT